MAKYSFWNWLNDIFHIDFSNEGRSPFGPTYEGDVGPRHEEGISSFLGIAGLSSFSDLLKALANRYTGASLTPAEKEAAALQLSNQQTLNEEDFQRKIDFYERFESPQAMMQQYKAAGLNPALMYQGAPSVSASGGVGAGSAQAVSPDVASISSLIQAIGGISVQNHRLKMEYDLKQRELDLESRRVGAMEKSTDADVALKSYQTQYESVRSKWADKVFDVETKNVQARTDFLVDQLKTGQVQRALFSQNISESVARSALYRVQTAIANSDAAVRDRYNSLMLRLSGLQAEQMSTYNSYQGKLLQSEYNHVFQQTMNLFEEHNILKAEGAIRWKDYEYYKSNRNWEHGLGVARVAVTAGAAAGAALISKGAVRPSSYPVNIYGPQSAPSWLNSTPNYGPIR